MDTTRVDTVSGLISLLRKYSSPGVFNPWRDIDPIYDAGSNSPQIRRRQLEHYFTVRLKTVRFCLLGEAVGYQGGHFTGMAMMSERILLGHCRKKGLPPEAILTDLKPARTSKPEFQPFGFNEPTATIVWDFIARSGRSPLEFVTWNSFPWHPYKPEKGMLSNRTPSLKEAEIGLAALKNFLGLFPRAKLIALGRVAEFCLGRLGIKTERVRHPAMGGAVKFRDQMKEILENV